MPCERLALSDPDPSRVVRARGRVHAMSPRMRTPSDRYARASPTPDSSAPTSHIGPPERPTPFGAGALLVTLFKGRELLPLRRYLRRQEDRQRPIAPARSRGCPRSREVVGCSVVLLSPCAVRSLACLANRRPGSRLRAWTKPRNVARRRS